MPQRRASSGALLSRNIRIGSHYTSFRVDPLTWRLLQEIAQRERVTVHELCTAISSVVALAVAGPWLEGRADDVREHENHGGTQTPIKHVIVLIGENHSFDNVFATYRPKHGRLVSNLLAKGIIRPDGSPGPNALEAAQFMVTPPLPANYFISTSIKTPYSRYLPTPELGGAPNHAISLAELLAGVQSNPAGVQPHSIIRSPKRGWRRSSLPWSRPILICSAQGPLVPRDRPGSTHASPMPRCCRTRCSH
jgi:hypothetical protein